ncbi:DUF6000 family protein [Streptomyces avermitilis]|uniref:DUF6000 family protein n=1 Tax=Streptomyces avermitilis TaxID=33903 RepID=UPI003F4D3CB2
MALASFGTPRDSELLVAYLDRCLRRPDLAYDQTVAMGALRFIDLNLQGDQAARFLGPGGLWQQWLQDASHMQDTTDPATYLSLIRRLLPLRRRVRRSEMTATLCAQDTCL